MKNCKICGIIEVKVTVEYDPQGYYDSEGCNGQCQDCESEGLWGIPAGTISTVKTGSKCKKCYDKKATFTVKLSCYDPCIDCISPWIETHTIPGPRWSDCGECTEECPNGNSGPPTCVPGSHPVGGVYECSK